MRGLFFSAGIHAAGIAGLLALPAFTRGDPPPVEPVHRPLVAPSIVRGRTGDPLRPTRARSGGGGMLAPRQNAQPVPSPGISERPLGPPVDDPGTDVELPPGKGGDGPGIGPAGDGGG